MKIILEAISAVFWLTMVVLLTTAIFVLAILFGIVRIFNLILKIPSTKYTKLALSKAV